MNFCVTKFCTTSIDIVIQNLGFTEFIVSVEVEHVTDGCLISHGCVVLVEVQHVSQGLEVTNDDNVQALQHIKFS